MLEPNRPVDIQIATPSIQDSVRMQTGYQLYCSPPTKTHIFLPMIMLAKSGLQAVVSPSPSPEVLEPSPSLRGLGRRRTITGKGLGELTPPLQVTRSEATTTGGG